jgi:hypothetical protein
MSQHSRTRSCRPSRRDPSTQTIELWVRPQQTLPVILVLIVWRWRWETLTLTALYVLYSRLQGYGLTALLAVTTMLAALAVLLVGRPSRRLLRTRLWCVITRHRLRSCLAEMRTLNYSGNLPLLLHAHGTKVGESVWLWMRPGLAITDLENRVETPGRRLLGA